MNSSVNTYTNFKMWNNASPKYLELIVNEKFKVKIVSIR